jgi:ABC-type molybdate transport system ATPase subunit
MTLLCEEICILDRGRKVASGPPADLFGADRLPASGVPEGPVNVIRGVVESIAESLAVVAVEEGLAVAVADDGSLRPGQRIAFELRGTEILLARGPVAGLSAQNVLASEVRGIHALQGEEAHAPVVVSAAFGRSGPGLAVVVSRRAARELALAPGEAIQLIFKAQVCRLLATYSASAEPTPSESRRSSHV